MVISQEVKDIFLFGIVAVAVLIDIIFMIVTTAVSNARLGREYREIEGDEVSFTVFNCKVT